MATRITSEHINLILKLYDQYKNYVTVAKFLDISPSTVRKYVQLYRKEG